MADIKISEMTTASTIEETDNIEISQTSGNSFVSLKANILAIAQKILKGINFTSDLSTTDKTIIGAINEVSQGGGGSGGHTILNDSGTELAQEDDLQFKGIYTHDDSVNGKTVAEVYREMTLAQFNQLSASEKLGFIRITDDDYVCDATEVSYDTANDVSVKDKIDDLDNIVAGIQNGTVLTLDPTTNETYASLFARFRTVSSCLSDGNYNFYIIRFRPAGASASSNLIFSPTRFVGNSVVEYTSFRTSDTAIVFYNLQISTNSVVLRQFILDSNGVGITDLTNNTAQSGIRVMGLKNNE